MNENANSLKTFRNGLIAGYSAGLCGIIVGHPLDSIKVLLQTQNNGSSPRSRSTSASEASSRADTAITRASNSASASASSSSGKANVSTAASRSESLSMNEIIGTRSLRALYAGMAGPLLASGAIRSVNFAVYDSVRRELYNRQQSRHHSHNGPNNNDYLHHDPLSNVAIASFVSGASTSLFTSPMALVKTKQQIMVWGFRKTVLDTFRNGGSNHNSALLRGVSNFYTGFGIHFTCDAVGTMVYFTSYEFFKRVLARRKVHDAMCFEDSAVATVTTHNLSLPERMLSAASAGMVCWAVIFPYDVIRSRLYSQSIHNETRLSGMELARQMVREQGVRSLYRGMGITVARAGPVAAAVLPVYDCVLDWLSRC